MKITSFDWMIMFYQFVMAFWVWYLGGMLEFGYSTITPFFIHGIIFAILIIKTGEFRRNTSLKYEKLKPCPITARNKGISQET